jgi:hypothetical protein
MTTLGFRRRLLPGQAGAAAGDLRNDEESQAHQHSLRDPGCPDATLFISVWLIVVIVRALWRGKP